MSALKKAPIVAAVMIACAAEADTRLLRHPDVSETHIVFAHANDLWIVGREGGAARRLTTAIGAESDPHFSPDGSMVAFTGQYDGNSDVYVVPIEGGSPKRLTFHPMPDVVKDWTSDGARVVFASGRDRAPIPYSRYWTIGLEDAMPEPMALPRVAEGKLDAKGERMAYQESSMNDVEWRNYRGGQAKPIWLVDMETFDRTTLPWDGSRDTDPVWLNGMVYFLSDRDHTVNIYRYNPGNGSLRQVTHHKEFDAKRLEAGGGALVYEHGGRVRLYNPETGTSRVVDIEVRGDFPWKRPHWTSVAGMLQNPSLSPTGQRALFEARGEIFTVPVEHGDVRNLTRSPGSAERFPAWSPDGRRIAWFSDASGEYRLMIGEQDAMDEPREIVIPRPTFFYSPAWSPDGKKILFTDEARNLLYVDVETEEVARVDGDQFAFPQRTLNPVWSPDSSWIAYAKRLDSKMRAIFAHSLKTGKTHQLTDGMSDASNPAFDKNGKYLYFFVSTNAALTTGWLDMSALDRTVTRGVYVMVLQGDEPSPLAPRSDEEPVKVEPPAEAVEPSGEEAPADDDAGGNAEAAAESPAEEETDEDEGVRIDMEGLDQRILALPMPQRNYTSLAAGAEGVVFLSEASYALGSRGWTLHRFSMREREAQPFMEGTFGFTLSHDGSKLLYAAPGNVWGVVPAQGRANVGQGRLATQNLQMKVDPPAEWEQIFHEAWRLHRDYFYVDNLHGADWDAVRHRYEPWLEDVSHRADLTHLLDIVGGEIAVGHSFTGGGDAPSADFVPMGLLGADYEVTNGRYRIKKIYRGENWNPGLRAPLSQPGLDVREGEYILAANGREIDDTMNIYGAFERTAGAQVKLHVNSEPTMDGARVVTVEPVASEFSLRQRDWMEANRRKVHEMSDGRLAYVWLPNTGPGGFTNFNRYYFAQQDKHGAIVDERFNGGGYAADYMVDFMSRQLMGFFNNPIGDREPFTNPQAGIWGPKVMLINDTAGSGGDLLPYMFREMGIGPLVGTRTWGGLVGIWDFPTLIDGGVITIPRGGFYNMDGEWAVENEGVAPDIHVEFEPKAVIAGRDPQLERAVEEALRLLEEEGRPEIIPEPPGPVRAKRAK